MDDKVCSERFGFMSQL